MGICRPSSGISLIPTMDARRLGVRTCVRDLGRPFRRTAPPAGRRPRSSSSNAEKGDRKSERAALKYLRRYLEEADPSLADVAPGRRVACRARGGDARAVGRELPRWGVAGFPVEDDSRLREERRAGPGSWLNAVSVFTIGRPAPETMKLSATAKSSVLLHFTDLDAARGHRRRRVSPKHFCRLLRRLF